MELRTDIVAPTDTRQPWRGNCARHPADYGVQVVIPHLDTPEPLALALDLWRVQTVRPYLCIIDTGSTAENCERLEQLRAEDCEIHYVRSHGWQHPSQPVSVAQDLALAVCQQEYQFCTHSDVFPMRRDLLEWYAGQCGVESPAVGYEISPRNEIPNGWLKQNWKGLLGHTATMLHVPTIKRHGITWDYERAMQIGVLSRQRPSDFDTEVGFGLLLKTHGIPPKIVGHDVNRQRQVDANIDHVRSHSSSQILDTRYHTKTAQPAMEVAMTEARDRIAQWRRSAA